MKNSLIAFLHSSTGRFFLMSAVYLALKLYLGDYPESEIVEEVKAILSFQDPTGPWGGEATGEVANRDGLNSKSDSDSKGRESSSPSSSTNSSSSSTISGIRSSEKGG